MLFLDGTVVVDEDKSTFVVRIRIALGSLIAWTQIALGIRSVSGRCRMHHLWHTDAS